MNTTKERKLFFKKLRGLESDGGEMSFIEHLEVLRWHLMRSALALVIVAIVVFINIDFVFDNIIFAPANSSFVTYGFLCKLSHALYLGESLCMPPIEIHLLGSTVSGPFMSAISISFIGAVVVAFPYLMFELWLFIKPALSDKELSYGRGAIGWVSLCFFSGAAFGYFLLAPFTFNFLANFQLGTMGAYQYLPTLDDFISTLTSLVLGCGLAFELPVLAFVLSKLGIITPQMLRDYRKYAFVAILVLAAIITPSPDWTSQLIVAVPLILLYEISILISRRVASQKIEEEKQWE